MDSDEVGAIKKKLEEHEQRIFKLEGLISTKSEAVQKKISIKEFILSKKITDDIQKTLAIGYYLEKYKNFSSFNKNDLEEWFGKSKEDLPKNINDNVNKNIKHGHMMEADEKKEGLKAWVVTITGEGYVENDFKEEE